MNENDHLFQISSHSKLAIHHARIGLKWAAYKPLSPISQYLCVLIQVFIKKILTNWPNRSSNWRNSSKNVNEKLQVKFGQILLLSFEDYYYDSNNYHYLLPERLRNTEVQMVWEGPPWEARTRPFLCCRIFWEWFPAAAQPWSCLDDPLTGPRDTLTFCRSEWTEWSARWNESPSIWMSVKRLKKKLLVRYLIICPGQG